MNVSEEKSNHLINQLSILQEAGRLILIYEKNIEQIIEDIITELEKRNFRCQK